MPTFRRSEEIIRDIQREYIKGRETVVWKFEGLGDQYWEIHIQVEGTIYKTPWTWTLHGNNRRELLGTPSCRRSFPQIQELIQDKIAEGFEEKGQYTYLGNGEWGPTHQREETMTQSNRKEAQDIVDQFLTENDDEEIIIRFENTINEHSKFWEIQRRTAPCGIFMYQTRWGKIGTMGSFNNMGTSNIVTLSKLRNLIQSKLDKGYKLVNEKNIINKKEDKIRKTLEGIDLFDILEF